MPLGHEPAGEVMGVGRDVEGLEVGARVVFNPVFDEADAIGNGGSQGALSDQVVIRDARLGRNLFQLPDDVPHQVAALTEPLSVALHAVNRSEAQAGQTAVVFGAGPVGAGIVAWLERRGLRDIVSVDLSRDRLALVSELGADATVAADEDVLGTLRSRHGTEQLYGAAVAGTDVWIDAAGAPQVIDTILKGARLHATAVIVGVHKQPVAFDLVGFLIRELRFTSSAGYPTEFADVAAAMATEWRTFAPMISDTVPIDDVTTALALAGSATVRGKVMVTF